MENVGAADAGVFSAKGGRDGGAALAEAEGRAAGSGAVAALADATGAAEAAVEALGAGAVTEALDLTVVRLLGVATGDEQLQRNTLISGQNKALRTGMTEHRDTDCPRWARFLGKTFWRAQKASFKDHWPP